MPTASRRPSKVRSSVDQPVGRSGRDRDVVAGQRIVVTAAGCANRSVHLAGPRAVRLPLTTAVRAVKQDHSPRDHLRFDIGAVVWALRALVGSEVHVAWSAGWGRS